MNNRLRRIFVPLLVVVSTPGLVNADVAAASAAVDEACLLIVDEQPDQAFEVLRRGFQLFDESRAYDREDVFLSLFGVELYLADQGIDPARLWELGKYFQGYAAYHGIAQPMDPSRSFEEMVAQMQAQYPVESVFPESPESMVDAMKMLRRAAAAPPVVVQSEEMKTQERKARMYFLERLVRTGSVRAKAMVDRRVEEVIKDYLSKADTAAYSPFQKRRSAAEDVDFNTLLVFLDDPRLLLNGLAELKARSLNQERAFVLNSRNRPEDEYSESLGRGVETANGERELYRILFQRAVDESPERLQAIDADLDNLYAGIAVGRMLSSIDSGRQVQAVSAADVIADIYGELLTTGVGVDRSSIIAANNAVEGEAALAAAFRSELLRRELYAPEQLTALEELFQFGALAEPQIWKTPTGAVVPDPDEAITFYEEISSALAEGQSRALLAGMTQGLQVLPPELRQQMMQQLSAQIAAPKFPEATVGAALLRDIGTPMFRASPTLQRLAFGLIRGMIERIGGGDALVVRLDGFLARYERDNKAWGGTYLGLPDHWKRVTQMMKAGSALVDYFTFRDGDGWETYGACLLLPESDPIIIRLADRRSIVDLTARYHAALRDKRGLVRESVQAEFEEANRSLSELLWQPICALLPPGTAEIYIVPEAESHYLSFGGFVDSYGTPAIIPFGISYLSTTADLRPMGEALGEGAMIFAGVDYGVSELGEPSLEADYLRRIVLPELPLTAPEGEAVEAALAQAGQAPVIRLTGAAAEEHRLYASVDSAGVTGTSPRVLHFATHGFLLSVVERNYFARHEGEEASDTRGISGVAPLAPVEQSWLKVNLTEPLLTSGIALAGMARTFQDWGLGRFENAENDGWLSSAEAGTLDLSGTELVFLSACDTGVGDEIVLGEGSLSMSRAFRRAGSRHVVYTLWPVLDRSSKEFVTEFYGRYAATSDVSDSFATTQRELFADSLANESLYHAVLRYGVFLHASAGY